ncbi:unnamed protein product [Prunus brigantina]
MVGSILGGHGIAPGFLPWRHHSYLVLFWCNSLIKAYGKGTIVVPTSLTQLDLPTRVRRHFAFSQCFQNRACNGEGDGWSLLSDGYLPFTHEFLLVLALALCLTCLESHQRWNTMTAFYTSCWTGLVRNIGLLAYYF